MDIEHWRWIWLACAVVFGIGEIFTAGFFMLPFSVGAVAAFVLAWFEIEPVLQLVTFLAVSVLALLLFRRLAAHGEQRQYPVGANRFLDRRGIVLERVDRHANTGQIRIDMEKWRATTDGPPIEEGSEVRVVEVRGTRMVVERTDGEAGGRAR